jgi:hypothetical protein
MQDGASDFNTSKWAAMLQPMCHTQVIVNTRQTSVFERKCATLRITARKCGTRMFLNALNISLKMTVNVLHSFMFHYRFFGSFGSPQYRTLKEFETVGNKRKQFETAGNNWELLVACFLR